MLSLPGTTFEYFWGFFYLTLNTLQNISSLASEIIDDHTLVTTQNQNLMKGAINRLDPGFLEPNKPNQLGLSMITSGTRWKEISCIHSSNMV